MPWLNACVPCERRQLVQNTTAVVRSMAQTLQAIPPGGSCDEAATSEITRCIATLRAGSLRWAQHRMAAMEIRDEKDMETHQHISVERILEQQMQQLDLILTSNPALLAEVQTRSKAYLAGLATIYKQRRELQEAAALADEGPLLLRARGRGPFHCPPSSFPDRCFSRAEKESSWSCQCP